MGVKLLQFVKKAKNSQNVAKKKTQMLSTSITVNANFNSPVIKDLSSIKYFRLKTRAYNIE